MDDVTFSTNGPYGPGVDSIDAGAMLQQVVINFLTYRPQSATLFDVVDVQFTTAAKCEPRTKFESEAPTFVALDRIGCHCKIFRFWPMKKIGNGPAKSETCPLNYSPTPHISGCSDHGCQVRGFPAQMG